MSNLTRVPGERALRIASGPLMIALAVALVYGGAPAQSSGWHVDEAYGYKVRIPTFPRTWEQVPLQVGEEHILAKYVSTKTYRPKRLPDIEFMLEAHKPFMKVIYLAKDARFKDYHDYRTQSSADGAFLVSEKKPKAADSSVTVAEYKCEVKTVPRRSLAWIFLRDDGTRWILEFEILEDVVDELRSACAAVAGSFEITGKAHPPGVTESMSRRFDFFKREDRVEWSKLPAAERKAHRKKLEQRAMQVARERVPDKWTVKETAHLLILSEHDPKVTMRVVEEAESCFQWMEQRFGNLRDEYVRRVTVRLFASQGSYNVYQEESRNTPAESEQSITLHLDLKTGSRSMGLSGHVVDHFLKEKMPAWSRFKSDFPPWIEAGFNAIRYAYVEGGRIKLWDDADALREARRKKEIVPARTLIAMTDEEFSRRGWGITSLLRAQSNHLFTWILDSGARQPHLKDFLVTYLTVAAEEIERYEAEEQEREAAKKDGSGGLTERDKAIERQAENERLQRRHAEVAKRINARVTQGWTENQWRSLENGYRAGLE